LSLASIFHSLDTSPKTSAEHLFFWQHEQLDISFEEWTVRTLGRHDRA
jgi:hypothetical protein